MTGDSSLLKELLDHLAEADNDNLLLLQYSAEDASKIKVTHHFQILCILQKLCYMCDMFILNMVHILLIIYDLIQELSVALERTSAEVAATESELSSAQAEAAASQTTLDQLSTAFLQAAAHRDHLLAQWEITLNHIYQKANEQTLCIEVSYTIWCTFWKLYLVIHIIRLHIVLCLFNQLHLFIYINYSNLLFCACTR